jgi:hypothetical protein
MNRLRLPLNLGLLSLAVVGALASVAAAQAQVPGVGEPLPVTGAAAWGRHDWLYDEPSANEAAGKIVIHWFCSPKVTACPDDLARIVTLKENGRVYVVARIAGNQKDAKKLDPIRESEGVNQGSVAYGKYVTQLMKSMSFTGPASIIVGTDGKVAMVSSGSSPAELDARDAKVNAMTAAIKDYTVATSEPPKGVKPGAKFTFSISVNLASWLKYSAKTPSEFTLTAPPDFKCDQKLLKGPQLKVVNQVLTAQVTCSAPKGSYEAKGDIRFGYQTPAGGEGVGTDGAKWKFEVKP